MDKQPACWLCGKRPPVDESVSVSEEHLGDDGERPCRECLDEMLRQDAMTVDYD